MAGFICEHCGMKFRDLRTLVSNFCSKSPTKKHIPFEGGVKAEYQCKHCGMKFKDLRGLVSNFCSKSPTKKHIPLK